VSICQVDASHIAFIVKMYVQVHRDGGGELQLRKEERKRKM